MAKAKNTTTTINAKRIQNIAYYDLSLGSLINPNIRQHLKLNPIGVSVALTTLKELKDTNYQFGFDIFMSTDGIRFMPICLNGLGNRDNYGGRIVFVSSENK